jgi:hypothetical protein
MRHIIFEKDFKKPDAQLILLSGFIIMLGTLTFVVLLNNLILTANLPAAGLDISKQDIKEFRSLVISEVNYATVVTLEYSQDSETTNETLLRHYFLNYSDDLSRAISRVYATRGAAVELVLNNITFTSSITNRTITVQHFRQQEHFFPNKSLIIPMDGQQNNTLKAYRFVWDIVNNTDISVYEVLQNPVNMSNITSSPLNMTNISYNDFYLNISTDNIFKVSDGPGNVTNRIYSGGPFLIDFRDLNSSTTNWIYNQSLEFTPAITVHGLREVNGTTLTRTIVMTEVPSVAVYAKSNPGPITEYYSDSDMDLPISLLDDDDVLNNLTLENYSVLLIHYNMTMVDPDVTRKIKNWTADGGVLFAESIGAVTMDAAVDYIDNNTAHPWYGFIGINGTNSTALDAYIGTGPYVKLINDSSVLNKAPMPFAGLVDTGASFNPLAQNDNISGMYGPSTGEVMAFTLNKSTDAVNPDTNIIGYAAFPNGSQIIYDEDADNESEYHFAYLEAPFEKGRVIYMAGNLSERGVQAERIAAEIFYASVSYEELALETNNVNVTISYMDGRANYSDTFIITI